MLLCNVIYYYYTSKVMDELATIHLLLCNNIYDTNNELATIIHLLIN